MRNHDREPDTLSRSKVGQLVVYFAAILMTLAYPVNKEQIDAWVDGKIKETTAAIAAPIRGLIGNVSKGITDTAIRMNEQPETWDDVECVDEFRDVMRDIIHMNDQTEF